MNLLATLLTIACVGAFADHTDIDQSIIQHLTRGLNANGTLDSPDLSFLNKTLPKLSFDKDVVEKLNEYMRNYTVQYEALVKLAETPVIKYDDGVSRGTKENPVEESPDYASSVVLASDILALTNAVANVQENTCREQGFQFLDGLLQNKRWALKMFDASAKSPQGLLFGSSYHMGNFDECVGIDASDDDLIEGQYCLATIEWKRKERKEVRTSRGETLRWAVCVPKSCNPDAVGQFVADVLSTVVGNTTKVIVTDRDCYSVKPLEVSQLDVWFLAIILFFASILTLATIYEVLSMFYFNNKGSILHNAVLCFSVIYNTKKIISTRQNNALGLDCIAGIKALAMSLIIASHACLFIGSGPVMDAEAWNRLVRTPFNSLMTNNMLLVETFLLISAFLFSRLLLIELDKRRGRVNILPILIFRYIRITPAYAVVLLFYVTWLPKIGEGPLWKERLDLEQDRCLMSWWTNLLYINNYVNTKDMCMFQSWYLSVDTQMFFVAPIFIYSLWRWRKLGPTLISIAIVISLIIAAVYTFIYHLDPSFLFYAKEFTDIIRNYYFNTAYIKTHMKLTTYFLGLLTGYILHRIQTENYQFSRQLKIFGWIVSIVLGFVTIFSISIFYQPWYEYNSIEAAAYQALHRLAWGISNSWLIIACATGNGGFMNKLLCWKFLVPISRLTFCAYLVNGIIELYYVGTLRHPLHITFFNVMATGLSHLVLTFCLALVLCLTFESPLHGLEKILLKMFVQPISENAHGDALRVNSQPTSQSRLET